MRFAPVRGWVEAIASHAEIGLDTFIYWPVVGQEREQLRLFAEEVVPGVREQLGQE
jgi:hypothetical protein